MNFGSKNFLCIQSPHWSSGSSQSKRIFSMYSVNSIVSRSVVDRIDVRNFHHGHSLVFASIFCEKKSCHSSFVHQYSVFLERKVQITQYHAFCSGLLMCVRSLSNIVYAHGQSFESISARDWSDCISPFSRI